MPRKSEQPYKGKANLSVLFGDEESPTPKQVVKLDSITVPSGQPRRYFDPVKMERLIQSVKKHGVLENLLVRPLPERENQYELVAGERRYRAAQAAGLLEVPVTIRELSDEQTLQISLIENLQREDLNPLEETEGILQLLSFRLQMSVDEITSLLHRMQHEVKGQVAQNVLGSDREDAIQAVFDELGRITWESFVSSRLPLLKLPSDILQALRTGQIEYTKATAIARVKDAQQRQSLLEEALAEDLSLTQIRERIRALRPSPEAQSPKAQIEAVTRRVTQSKLWEDPKKWKRAQALLKKLEELVEEE